MQVLNIPIIFWQIVENTTDTKELQDNFAIAENMKYVKYVMNKYKWDWLLDSLFFKAALTVLRDHTQNMWHHYGKGSKK